MKTKGVRGKRPEGKGQRFRTLWETVRRMGRVRGKLLGTDLQSQWEGGFWEQLPRVDGVTARREAVLGRTGRARCTLLGTGLPGQREGGMPGGKAGRQDRWLWGMLKIWQRLEAGRELKCWCGDEGMSCSWGAGKLPARLKEKNQNKSRTGRWTTTGSYACITLSRLLRYLHYGFSLLINLWS